MAYIQYSFLLALLTVSTRLDPLPGRVSTPMIGFAGDNATQARFSSPQRDNSSLPAAAATASSGAFTADFKAHGTQWTREAAMGLTSHSCSLDGMKQSHWAKPRASVWYFIDPTIRFIEELVAFNAFNSDKDGALSILVVLNWFLTNPRLWLFVATSAVLIFIISCTKLISKAADRPSPPPPPQSEGSWLGSAAVGTGAAVTISRERMKMGSFDVNDFDELHNFDDTHDDTNLDDIDDANAVAAQAAQAAEAVAKLGRERLTGMMRVRGGGRAPSEEGLSVGSTQPDALDDGDDTNLDDIDVDYGDAPRPTVTIGAPSEEMIRVLSGLDDRLADALRAGDIKLLRVSWLQRLRRLLRQPNGRRLKRRQELEALFLAPWKKSPFLSAVEAVALLRRGNRGVGALTHGWLSPGECDPDGARLDMVLAALEEHPHIEGVFWDYASLFQNLPDRERTPDESDAFKRAIKVMADVYASAVGTTVLQSREIPPRPEVFDGALCLFGLKPTTDEAAVRATLGCFGAIVALELTRNPPVVRFASHEAALAAKRAGPWAELCDGVDTLYNERPYDERGWCVFENAVSYELLARLRAVPRVREALDALPPKALVLRSGLPTEPGVAPAGQLETRVAEMVASIERATFTGKGDKDTVPALYREYVGRIVGVVQSVLALVSGGSMVAPAELPPLPQVDAPAASPLRLAEGQPLLLLTWQGSDAGGGPRFGVVDATGGRVAAAVTGGDNAELAYDRCSQAVLPWRSPAAGWDAAFVGDARALRDLAEPARGLADDARRMDSESAVRAVGERAREIADGAARCHTIAHAAREAGGAVQLCVDAAAKLFSNGDPTQLQAALGKVRAAIERLQPVALEAALTAALYTSGALGARRYAAGQPLTVRTAGGWRDADVVSAGADGLYHQLTFKGSGEPPATLTLHPWNHATRELPHTAYEAMRDWWARSLRANHAHIPDALTGKRLDALQQCVAIGVDAGVGGAAAAPGTEATAAIRDAHSLTAWLLAQHGARLEGGPTDGPLAALLTAGPASGKTTLLSQVVTLALQDERTELVPILVKVQVLQRRLLEAPDAFAGSWNYIDAFLCLEHEASQPALYRMLRQAIMARRALLLLDGLDEAGAKRAEIEHHVADVLAPQGHVLLCTSRPAGVDEARFAAFRRLALEPLSDEQQERALEQRLGAERAAALLTYVRDVMPRDDTGQKVTSNPLMLSMVAAVYELRQGVGMPRTVAELYATASDAMLARGGVKTAELARLLQRIFFEAHVAQRRLIEDRQLDEAALGLEAPGVLAQIRAEAAAKMAFEPFGGRAEMGHYVEVTKEGEHKGKRGVITAGGKTSNQYRVTFANGKVSGWLQPNELRSSGLVGEMAVLQRAMDASVPVVRAACEARLSVALREALRTVRERVLVDALPLLSLWQSEPLLLQSSHLSFQEYFAAIALCDEGTELSGTPPWQWPVWWANAVKLGAEIPGDRFGRGLLRAAGVTGDTLDLSEKLGGDRPTVRRVLVAVVANCSELTTLNLSQNKLDAEDARALAPALMKTTALENCSLLKNSIGDDGAKLIAEALKVNAVLTSLHLYRNSISAEGAIAIAEALKVNAVLKNCNLLKNSLDVESATMLAKIGTEKGIMLSGMERDQTEADLDSQGLQPADAILIGSDLKFMAVVTTLYLSCNNIGFEGAIAIAEALKVNAVLTALRLDANKIGPEGAMVIAEALKVNTVLTILYLRANNIGVEGAIAIAKALKVNAVLTELWLQSNNIGDDGAKVVAEALKVNAVLTTLDLGYNSIGVEGANAIAEVLKVNAVLTELNLYLNNIGDDGAKAIAKALMVNAVLTKLWLGSNFMKDAGKQAVRDAVKDRSGFVLEL
jgi:Ran GTPase-activating protein (RanGAP) involved in mRNA processing and transport